MKFETLPLSKADGAILAHALRLPQLVVAKGRRLDVAQLASLRAAGVQEIAVALIEAGDVAENDAASRAARNLVGDGIVAKDAHTGRVNLCSTRQGILVLEARDVNALNRIDEAMTIATLPLHDVVEAGEIVATVKVNPYAVGEEIVASWEANAKPLTVVPFRPHRASLIQTLSSALKDSVLKKTVATTKDRLEALGSSLSTELRTPHSTKSLASAIRQRVEAGDQLILICGASSITDRRDVIPSAIVAAGGRIEHFGMPVDPGNLLLLGAVGNIPVIGMPGCARTPQLNGFDHVLRLLLAGLPIGPDQVVAMGVGGLLRPSPWRPARRAIESSCKPAPSNESAAPAPRIAALVLAAGQSSRMGANKLRLSIDGKPVLHHVVDTISASGLTKIVMVLGHEAEDVRALFGETDIQFVLNEHYRQGLSTSLQCGIASLPPTIDGAMIFLGDMPDVDAALVKRMVAAFDPSAMRAIVVPRREGRRGHPILWGRQFFRTLIENTAGDTGGRHLIGQNSVWVAEIDVDHDGIFTDLDTPEDLALRQAATQCEE
jgi:molybdenum cofactor cytidylyltransferase